MRYCNGFTDIRSTFDKLIDEEMIQLIVAKTNMKLELIIERFSEKIACNSRYGFVRKTDTTEIYALIGIIYFRGLLGLNNHSHEILFSEKAGHPVFAATMSRNRFKLLIQSIMFDDHQERAVNWPHDRFAAIRNFFELFNKNSLKHVIPSEYFAINETLYAMRNQISIKQYNPNKPAKYGLLFKSLNDACFPYIRIIV